MVFGGELLFQTLSHGRQGSTQLVDRHARLKPRIRRQNRALNVVRNENIGGISVADQAAIVVGKDTEDRVEPAIQPDRLADDRRIGIQAGAPEAWVEHDDIVVVAFPETAPPRHRYAQHREEIFGGLQRKNAPCLLPVVEIDEALFVFSDDVFKDAAAAKLIDNFRVDMAVSALTDIDQRFRIVNRRLAQEKLHGQGENCRVDANAERERCQRSQDKSRACP